MYFPATSSSWRKKKQLPHDVNSYRDKTKGLGRDGGTEESVRQVFNLSSKALSEKLNRNAPGMQGRSLYAEERA